MSKLAVRIPSVMGAELIQKDLLNDVELYCVSCQGWVKWKPDSDRCARCNTKSAEAAALSLGIAAAKRIQSSMKPEEFAKAVFEPTAPKIGGGSE